MTSMTTTSLDPIAVDQQHVLQVYRRAPVVFDPGAGCALFSRERRSLSGSDFRHRRRVARPRPPGACAGDCRSGRDADAHVEPVPSPAAGRARAAAVGSLRAAASVLLQQRRGSGRGVPEVRAPVLAARAAARADRFVALQHSFHGRTMGALSVTWDEHYRDAVRAAVQRRDVRRPPTTPRPLPPAITERYSRGHRRADTRRRRRAAAAAADRRRDCRRVPQRQGAAHRRRSAVRSRANRACRSTRRRLACSRT